MCVCVYVCIYIYTGIYIYIYIYIYSTYTWSELLVPLVNMKEACENIIIYIINPFEVLFF